MISSKNITKIGVILISLVLILCIGAMIFSDQLAVMVGVQGYAMEYEESLFNTDNIIDINITMDSAEWEEMLRNARSEEYYKCDVVINGQTFYSVAIRPKGNTSLSSIASDPDNNRYSFKLEFDHFVGGQTCFGLDKLVLNNSYADATNMKEAIIYDMFAYLEADASLYNYAKISVNGEYWGVYLALEAVEDSFMLRNYGNEKGELYKPDSMDFGGNRDREDNKGNNRGGNFQMPRGGMPQFGGERPQGGERPGNMNFGNRSRGTNQETGNNPEGNAAKPENGQGAVRNMPQGGFGGGNFGGFGGFGGRGSGANLNYIDDNTDSYSAIWNGALSDIDDSDKLRVIEALKNISTSTEIEKYMDVDNLLKYMAVHNFAVNDDSLSGGMAHNYYLYEAGGKLNILPWDYNLAFGGMHGGTATSVINEPIDDSYNSTTFFDVFLTNEEYKARYHEYYNKLVEGYFDSGRFEAVYNRIRSQIDELLKTDPTSMFTYDEYEAGAEAFREVLLLRAESVRGQLAGTIPSTTEGQRADSSALVDASSVNLSDLGKMNMGRR